MRAFGYSWQPELGGNAAHTDDERALSTLLFGGLIFSAYAQRVRGLHLLESRRAGLFGRLAFGTAADDAELHARIAALPEAAPDAVSHALELPSLPSFLPYLIEQGPRTPQELLALALAQRTDRNVVAYRRWRQELADDLARGGNALQRREEFEAIRTRLDDRFASTSIDAKVSVKMVALTIPAPPEVELSASIRVRPREAWGWCVRKVKGDHRKVLSRLIGARQAFSRLDLALQEIWHAPSTR
jgi:hypothetical protein